MDDAVIDGFRFVGMAIRTMLVTTGTPMDFLRDLLNALLMGSEKTETCVGFQRVWGAYDEVGRWIEGMRRGKSVGLHLEPRENPPIAFHVVAWIHYAILAFCIAFPLMFGRDDGWDAVYLAFIVLVIVQWFVFCGECLFSYFEKKLFYERYEIGTMPNLHWFGDTIPWQFFLLLIVTSILGIDAAIATVIFRNVSSVTCTFSVQLL